MFQSHTFTRRKGICLMAMVLAGVICCLAGTSSSQNRHMNIIEIKDSINPGVEEFIRHVIERSENDGAEGLIILLDTPGGLVTSMRGIAQAILNSRVPIIVFVHPSGAQAASAGVFVTAAADIAAMAPGTNIGAASPVMGRGEDVPDTMSEKVIQDMLAFARSIASEKGRNAEWLQQAITESVSITAEEAFEKNVIDLVVSDVPALLDRLDGWQTVKKGETITFNTVGIEARTIEPSWQHKILRAISNPNIAYILLLLGLAGLYFELSQPGAIFPGVIGGIALILSLYAMQTLPVNYAGFLLILLATIFFILEITVPSFGLLSVAGVISLVLGSLMLFRTPDDTAQLAMHVFLPTVMAASAFFATVAGFAAKAQTSVPRTGNEAMVGKVGEVTRDLNPQGKVFVNGETWNAESEEPVAAGEKVVVLAVDNLKLKVQKIGAR